LTLTAPSPFFPAFLKAAYVSLLNQVFASEQADGTLRQLAGLALKNSLTAKVGFFMLAGRFTH
jgi:hypothetical protein